MTWGVTNRSETAQASLCLKHTFFQQNRSRTPANGSKVNFEKICFKSQQDQLFGVWTKCTKMTPKSPVLKGVLLCKKVHIYHINQRNFHAWRWWRGHKTGHFCQETVVISQDFFKKCHIFGSQKIEKEGKAADGGQGVSSAPQAHSYLKPLNQV